MSFYAKENRNFETALKLEPQIFTKPPIAYDLQSITKKSFFSLNTIGHWCLSFLSLLFIEGLRNRNSIEDKGWIIQVISSYILLEPRSRNWPINYKHNMLGLKFLSGACFSLKVLIFHSYPKHRILTCDAFLLFKAYFSRREWILM